MDTFQKFQDHSYRSYIAFSLRFYKTITILLINITNVTSNFYTLNYFIP